MKLRANGAIDMTQGNPYRLILLFTAPLLVGNILQQLYNMVDSIVVGNFIGEKALAAVGTGFPIIFMLVSMFAGLSVGTTVMISQFYGARDLERVKDTVNTIYSAMMVGFIPLAIIGVILSGPLLRLMNVPDDGTFEMARSYMMTVFAGIIGMLGYNINAGILQGLGDSRTSLLFLSIATVINIVLDLAFTFLGMGTFGVALATVIAQISSWLFGVFFINRHYDFFRLSLVKLRFKGDLFRQAMRLGIPSGIQQVLFSIGVMAMQSLVNGYGSVFMAGFQGANKIDTFAFLPIQSISNAMTTYTGQNIGAGDLDRVRKGTRAGLTLAVLGSIVIALILYPASGLIMQLFNRNPEVIAAGECYLHAVLPFYFLLAIQFVFTSVVRGAGDMLMPMLSSIVALWLARVPAAYLLADLFGKESIFYSYAVGWVIGVVMIGISYKRGKWKEKAVVYRSEETASVFSTEKAEKSES